jgi:hypothetical protein
MSKTKLTRAQACAELAKMIGYAVKSDGISWFLMRPNRDLG